MLRRRPRGRARQYVHPDRERRIVAGTLARSGHYTATVLTVCMIFFVAMLHTTEVRAQLEFSVSPSPVGSGARAAGMADAFIAIADDATAASWNPAGLVQLQRPEISIVGAFNAVSEEFHSSGMPDVDSSQYSDAIDLNFLSVVYPLPFSLGTKNLTLSLSYQRKYDFTRTFDVDFTTISNPGGAVNVTDWTFDFEQTGGFATLSPSLALELTETLSVGASFNFWRSSFLSENGWEKEVVSRAETTSDGVPLSITNQTIREEYEDLSGENYTIGVLWKVTPKFALGLRYDTSFTADADFESDLIRDGMTLVSVSEDREINFPDTWSIGASYRVNDRLTFAFDFSRTDWNDFYVERADGEQFSLIDGTNLDDPATHTEFDPTHTARLGAEYVLIPKTTGAELNALWSLRGGLFFDQEPASGRTLDEPVGDGHADDFYGIAMGVGLLAYQRVNIDLAYQFRYGHDVNGDFISGPQSFDEDVFQHRVLLSTVIYF